MYLNPIIVVSFLGSLILVSFAFIYLYYLYNRDREFREGEDNLYKESSKAFQKESQTVISQSQQELNKIAQALLTSYTNAFSDLKTDSLSKTRQALLEMQQHAESQVQEFAQILRDQTFTAQKEISQKITSYIEQSHSDIENYKKEQIEKLKQSIQNAAVMILSDVLSKSISEEEQEKLVMEALERAKKEGII